ncbi:hypothetical protein C1891_07745 [Pseudomonas sp. GW456-12-1-14-TSB6]|nr:hypothetical protein C1891_07745 [Pseudomonas sp. GW456-12-1-14-TSB6]
MIVPTLRVGMPQWTLRVRFGRDAERPGLHSHADGSTPRRGNDQAHSSRAGSPLHLPCVTLSHLSRQSRPSKQMDLKMSLSFFLLYPAQAF